MNLFAQAFAWLFAPERMEGTYALPTLLAQHLLYTVISVLIAAAIAVPAGWAIGHTGRGREVAVGISGAARAVPSFGLMVLLVLVLGVLRIPEAAVVTFVLLAIPSLLAGAYTGIEAVDRHVTDAARAMGMTEWQILLRVEIPLALPLLVGGFRSAVLQVVATATVAAYVGLGGLGRFIIDGQRLNDYPQMVSGSILVILLALALDVVFVGIQTIAVGGRAPVRSTSNA